jgi:hypothetical protein
LLPLPANPTQILASTGEIQASRRICGRGCDTRREYRDGVAVERCGQAAVTNGGNPKIWTGRFLLYSNLRSVIL